MLRGKIALLVFLTSALLSHSRTTAHEPQPPTPPRAERKPERLEKFGKTRTDDYFWLRNRQDPRVIAYLDSENSYTDKMTAHTRALQHALFEEIVGRIKQTDRSAPIFDHGYDYYSRLEAGRDYPVLARARRVRGAVEEVLVDENALARGLGYFSLAGNHVSPDNRILAFGIDTGGRRFHTIQFKDLESGKLLEDRIADTTANMAWANDSRTIFYTRQDPVTLRAYRIYRHRLGTRPADDRLVYEEPDETFSCHISRTKSDRFLLIACTQTLSTEFRYLDADHPEGEFRIVQARRPNLEYRVDHLGDHFYFRTNLGARNFRLMRAPVAAPGLEHWEEVVPQRAGVFLESFELFRDFLVLEERRDGLIRLRVRRWSDGEGHQVGFDEPAYDAAIGENHEMDTDCLRFTYASLTTPRSSFDYDMKHRTKTLVKRDEVLGGFDPASYVTERLHATAADGTRVPISIVMRKGFRKDGRAPLLLYGYGSYGASSDATFQPERLALLDRGFAFAIAHVRGGQELGRAWYEGGKLLHKKNTFTDFIACAEHLIREQYTRPDRLFAQGASAGGLLMGAVINMRPDLFKGVVAMVPFVDVVTTMLDASIPLTTSEYDEWGNPADRTYFDYMLSYSPYDNVVPGNYPSLLVTTALQDSQVQYWEPAKWVARLRATKTDSNRLLLRTYKEGSHGGVSGRYKRYEQTAFVYAFLLDLAGQGGG